MRRALTRRLAAFSLCLIAWGALPAQAPAGEGSPAGLPGYFEGFDPRVPTQETYRDWPPRELLERPFGRSWGPRAFRRAALFDQPVLFVLTVNWSRSAQRIAAETLQDPKVVHALNQGYILVLANADLRPDLRERYQSGSWPVVAFLLPDGNPMLARVGEAHERPITAGAVDAKALKFLLDEGIIYWNKRRADIREGGVRWAGQVTPTPPKPGRADAATSDLLARWMLGNADSLDGGFGIAPKFVVDGLDRYAALRAARGLDDLRPHARLTLEALLKSPLYDAREGGAHRLATAPSFGGIQYEKLLSVNAALIRELVSSLAGTDSQPMREALAATAGFLTTTLGREEGGFYLAQAADPRSVDGGGYWREGEGEPPPLDELVLSAPNARAGAALLQAGNLLDDDRLAAAGAAALDLVLEVAVTPGRGVGHVIAPTADPRVYLQTQAETALGLLDGFEVTGKTGYLDAAQGIVDFVRANLKDPKDDLYQDHLASPRSIGLLSGERQPLRANVRLARAMVGLARNGRGDLYRQEAAALLGAMVGDLQEFGVRGVEAGIAIEELLALSAGED
jgi:uncharacterized protein YyaL (SSP411 family)